ncbi:MAG: hypothetical protein P857_916 [Candidatus Xenolissoclinum pacificiensis L6]|uniref:Uncharacterized protein n=1 Tax=Candidatus Xenolissoclinum pacificiensis L6 TaxID=1401685 RepID=W2V2U1_9RICK|nr:MAG: hypothetical protein P857_916 [Candidatus Xenolissoclinum pacificiensis L6]
MHVTNNIQEMMDRRLYPIEKFDEMIIANHLKELHLERMTTNH